MERWSRLCWLGLALLAAAQAFAPLPRASTPLHTYTSTTRPISTQIAFKKQDYELRGVTKLEKILDRLDTMKSAGFVDPNSTSRPLMMRGPGFKRIAFWLFVGFMYKWYRARFINKIPVWDRQPQWNMVITSREQEKELKAYTCKTCGSTLFIAKNRNWFFEGDTGLGGLGCYTCGAKGKDNFVMDRDRILEDVGEDDDYFDYERPLDFVTAAERRALLKQAKGDEEAANQMLIDQSSTESSAPPEGAVDVVIEKTVEETKEGDETADGETDAAESGDKPKKDSVAPAGDAKDSDASSSAEVKPKKKKKKKKKKPTDTTGDAKDSDVSSSADVKQPTDATNSKKKKPKKDPVDAASDAKGSDASTSATAKQPEAKPKKKKPKKKVPETPPKKADDEGDPWDDLDALGI